MNEAPYESIEVRDVRFDVTGIPADWHPAGLVVSQHFDSMSILFPEGERFFVRSVKRFAHCVKGEPLKRDVAAFSAQEGHHGREHMRWNAHVESLGYPVARLEKRVARLLKVAEFVLPKRSQLAVTCALEHFTSMMADLVLGSRDSMNGAHPELQRLWRWHAAEESEHRSVAFDVYLAAGGGLLERALIMLLVSAFFVGKIVHHQVVFMHTAGNLRLSEWSKLVRWLHHGGAGLSSLWRPWLAYFSPRFHPRQRDTDALFRAWRSSFIQGA
jgi:predicted metal-dependent hydrolase